MRVYTISVAGGTPTCDHGVDRTWCLLQSCVSPVVGRWRSGLPLRPGQGTFHLRTNGTRLPKRILTGERGHRSLHLARWRITAFAATDRHRLVLVCGPDGTGEKPLTD
jgi:hypothetical protein